jgi:hypothetical protein
MKAVLYDCSDHPNPRWRGCTFRILDDAGGVLLQASVQVSARAVCERIAAGLGLGLTYVGPPDPGSRVSAAVDRILTTGTLDALAVACSTDPVCDGCGEPEEYCDCDDGQRFQGFLF